MILVLWLCSILFLSQYLRVWTSRRGMSMYLGGQQWQLLVNWMDLETPCTVCFDKFSIVYYSTLEVMPPLGISSIQETGSWCCIAECYFKITFSAHSSTFQKYSAWLWWQDLRMGWSWWPQTLRGILPETQLGGANERRHGILGMRRTSKRS